MLAAQSSDEDGSPASPTPAGLREPRGCSMDRAELRAPWLGPSAHPPTLGRREQLRPGPDRRVFSTVGKSGLWLSVDKHRGTSKGVSEKQARALAERRNQIAHSGDRVGRGRALLTLEEVEGFYINAKATVEAIDAASDAERGTAWADCRLDAKCGPRRTVRGQDRVPQVLRRSVEGGMCPRAQ